ncbi:hypothetical protein FH972_001049 [Carpinus fangiana]|uniref:Transmembrane protein n=1 Tax=Carpinus fangiana TaxID=176857 RepID=A0A5N6QAR0_9ROSI|nr:hypothetical protein FH972_001049 [Carpinus fangiana]
MDLALQAKHLVKREHGSKSFISSRGVIKVFMASVLIGLPQMHHQFGTHSANLWIVEAALVILCLSDAARANIYGTRWARYSKIIAILNILSGILFAASTIVSISPSSIPLLLLISLPFYDILALLQVAKHLVKLLHGILSSRAESSSGTGSVSLYIDDSSSSPSREEPHLRRSPLQVAKHLVKLLHGIFRAESSSGTGSVSLDIGDSSSSPSREEPHLRSSPSQLATEPRVPESHQPSSPPSPPPGNGDEVYRVGAVGVDAADHGCSEDHKLGLLGSEEGLHIALVGQVVLGVGAQDELAKPKWRSFRKMAEPTRP